MKCGWRWLALGALLLLQCIATPRIFAAAPSIRLTSVATRFQDSFHRRIVALVHGNVGRSPELTPHVEVKGAKLVQNSARPPLLFLHVVADTPRVSPKLTIRLPEPSACSLEVALPLSLNLADVQWQTRWLGKDTNLDGIDASPDNTGTWKPVRLPKEWQELGVTWVRTKLLIPEAWGGWTSV